MPFSEAETDDEVSPPSQGPWREWKEAFARFARSLASLAALRWTMARSEAEEWGRNAVLRLILFAGAAVLSLLSLVFLAVGLVLVFDRLLGTLIGAVFAVFGICVLGAAALVLLAMRRRMSRAFLERTAAEIRKDFDSWTGGEE